MNVAHHNIDRFTDFLRHELFHGRSFARVRVKAQGFSKPRRLVYAALWPLIAGKLLTKVSWRVLRLPGYRVPFLLAGPTVTLGILYWSLGEMTGYIMGVRQPASVRKRGRLK